ncbi:hypothetical protein L7F22_033059 [Adiantum nelumboides]|nr:hypothetical protein [Adiantum nelumboides]
MATDDSEEVCDVRFLGPTLVSAISSFALFLDANWDMNLYHIMFRMFLLLLMPWLTIFIAVHNMVTVMAMRQSLQRDLCDPHIVSIMTLCPLFIRAPMPLARDSLDFIADLDQVLKEEVETLHPLILQPSAAGCRLDDGGDVQVGSEEGEGEDGELIHVKVGLGEEPFDDDYDVMEIGARLLIRERVVCREFNERRALMEVRVAPSYGQASLLESKGTFQVVVAGVQACGYVAGVVQRLVRRAAVSPIEALTAFVSLLVIMQVPMQQMVCGDYRRPLMLSLDRSQFRAWLQVRSRRHQDSYPHRRWTVVGLALAVAVSVVVSVPAIYFGVHFLHTCKAPDKHWKMPHCFVLAFCFLGAGNLWLIRLAVTILRSDPTIRPCFSFLQRLRPPGSPFVSVMDLLYLSLFCFSFAFALWVTVSRWDKLFNRATMGKDWFAWIIPHVN